MAEKRMFTQKIVDSDAFLDMPLSAQALYFHLNMRADDDGFINNAKRIQRSIGATDEDLQTLISQRFLICFNGGVMVIKHWRMHNTLKRDRYKPTQYQEELALLDVKDNKAYTERRSADTTEPQRNQSGTETEPQYSIDKNRLVEDSIVKDSVVENSSTAPTFSQIASYVSLNNLNVDALRFFNYYEQNDWRTTKGNPIDWREKLKEWSISETQTAQRKEPSGTNPFLKIAKSNGII